MRTVCLKKAVHSKHYQNLKKEIENKASHIAVDPPKNHNPSPQKNPPKKLQRLLSDLSTKKYEAPPVYKL